MKNVKTALLLSLVTIITFWAIFAFVLLEANPFNWTQDTRMVFVMLLLIIIPSVLVTKTIIEE